MKQPADAGGELLRFRTGKEHAIIEGIQKALIADPSSFVDQLKTFYSANMVIKAESE